MSQHASAGSPEIGDPSGSQKNVRVTKRVFMVKAYERY